MHISRQLLEIIGKRIPAIYDVIPRGPQSIPVRQLEPVAMSAHDYGVEAARFVASALWVAQQQQSGARSSIALDDDWCGTGKIHFPKGWPIPKRIDDAWRDEYRYGFGIAMIVARRDLDLSGAFAADADRLIDHTVDLINARADKMAQAA